MIWGFVVAFAFNYKSACSGSRAISDPESSEGARAGIEGVAACKRLYNTGTTGCEVFLRVTYALPTEPAYLSLEDFRYSLDIPGLLRKHATRMFVTVDGNRQDLISLLIDQLKILFPEDAIGHFIQKNDPEINAIVRALRNRVSDFTLVRIALRIDQVEVAAITSNLRNLLQRYVNGRRAMPLYDELPMTLRHSKYSIQ